MPLRRLRSGAHVLLQYERSDAQNRCSMSEAVFMSSAKGDVLQRTL